jgi:predicted peptidase
MMHHREEVRKAIRKIAVAGLIISFQHLVFSLDQRTTTRKQAISVTGKSLVSAFGMVSSSIVQPPEISNAVYEHQSTKNDLKLVADPNTYSALSYSPPQSKSASLPPLILLLHGAGKNSGTAWDLANPKGEHAGLIPSLIATGQAPAEIQKCAMLSPYSMNSPSFYNEPRSKLISFVEWAKSQEGQAAGCPLFDPRRIVLFGFSDGATVAVELLTTKRFCGGVVCSYGFTGYLPEMALDRLANIPMWVFHSRDDVIFDVANSDRLVNSLRKRESASKKIIRYSRFESDPEDFPSRVRGHTMGITASRTPEVYDWIASLPPVLMP